MQMVMSLYGTASPPANPNAWMFTRDGKPKRLMWCTDDAHLGGPCPYEGRDVPLGVCCKALVTQCDPVAVQLNAASERQEGAHS